MMTAIDKSARAAVQIIRAAPLFDRLADTLVSYLAQGRDSLDAEGDIHFVDDRELMALRERLDGFFPEFRRMYFSLLVKHVGVRLPEVLAALNSELVQIYFRALMGMEPELITELQKLGEKMASSLSGAQDTCTAQDVDTATPARSVVATPTL